MAVRDARDLQLWGGVAVVAGALMVVAGYLVDGAPLVWAVASVEVLLVMVYVARRFRYLLRREHPGTPAGPFVEDAAHCERCRRAREQRDALASRRAGASAARPADGLSSAGRVVGHQ
ncbi:hypothetical protein ACIGXM_07800 [Kitasatospora sp. NPDC052896]|uniref:hypothetical protein n=1 Tax=Kitasatospora sp. NPDC052896 TaxID=3364061 RepID=UPI0037CA9DE5